MKKWKKIIALALTAGMVLSTCSTVWAEDTVQAGEVQEAESIVVEDTTEAVTVETGITFEGDNAYYYDANGNKMKGWIKGISSWTGEPAWFYADANGVLAAGWKAINGKWYYFDEYDYDMYEDGWYYIDGKTYYFDASGAMMTGWIKDVETWYDEEEDKTYSFTDWYYAESNGVLVKGWKKLNNVWYYFDEYSGYMYNDAIYEIDGVEYQFLRNGALANGWVMDDWGDYKYAPGGIVTTGWKAINGKWYYFNEYGWMYSDGVYDIDGKCYYLSKSGAMMTGWFKDEYDNWIYANNSGVLASGWQTVGGKEYYFDDDGRMATSIAYKNDEPYLLGNDGALVTTPGWYQKTNKWGETNWYYVADKSGKLYVGWLKSGGKWYYLDYSMFYNGLYEVYNETIKDWEVYWFDKSGAMVVNPGWCKIVYSYDNGRTQYTDWGYQDANSGGKMVSSSWKQIAGKWYYFDEYGQMATGSVRINENGVYKLYYFDQNGVWIKSPAKGWLEVPSNNIENGKKIPSQWYYFDAPGVPHEGWLASGTNWYYCYSDGYMAKDGLVYVPDSDDDVPDQQYVFDASGKMLRNSWYQVTYSGEWYYADANGRAYNGWLKSGNKWYYFDGGYMYDDGVYNFDWENKLIYAFDQSGAMITTPGWVKDGSGKYAEWYYVKDSSGKCATDQWIKSGNAWYYVNSYGEMVSDCVYYLDNEGRSARFAANGAFLGYVVGDIS